MRPRTRGTRARTGRPRRRAAGPAILDQHIEHAPAGARVQHPGPGRVAAARQDRAALGGGEEALQVRERLAVLAASWPAASAPPSTASAPSATLAVRAAPRGRVPVLGTPSRAQSLASTKAPLAEVLVLRSSMQNPGGVTIVTGAPATRTVARVEPRWVTPASQAASVRAANASTACAAAARQRSA